MTVINRNSQIVNRSLLFVCQANQCRSPIAEVIFKQLLDQRLGPIASTEWQVVSKGTWVQKIRPAHHHMRAAATQMGLDLRNHQSKGIETVDDLRPYGLILTMTQSQKEALQIEFPAIAQRVYLLSEMVDLAYDIADPIGGPAVGYLQTAQEIERLLNEGWQQILERVKSEE